MRKWWIGSAVALVLLALAVAAVAVFGGPRILAGLIRRSAATLGYQDVRVEVASVGPYRTVLPAISAGPEPGLQAEDVTLEYDWRSLVALRVHRVAIGAVRLHGDWNEDGMVFPALPEAEAGGPLIAVPAWEVLSVASGAVVLGGARGPVTVSFADFEASAPPGHRLTAKGRASIDSPAAPIDADFDLALDDDRVHGFAQVRSRDGKLDLRGDFGAVGEGPGVFPTVESPGQLRLSGRIRVKADEADLSPFAPAFTADGTVTFGTDHGRLQIRGDGLDLTTAGISLAGLDVALDLDQLAPPVGGRGQRIAVDTARMGVDLGGGTVRFGVRPNGVIDVESLEWSLHGGRLHTAAALDLSAEENAATLGVSELDIGRLVAGLGRDDLEVTGIVSGDLALRVAGDRIFADGGRLTASEAGGVIRYRPGGPGDPADAGPPESGAVGGMELVLDALENFHYRTLEVGVTGELTGEMNLKLSIEGSNPEVYDGYPFQINLNLEGPVADVVRGSQTGFRIQDAIEERFRQR